MAATRTLRKTGGPEDTATPDCRGAPVNTAEASTSEWVLALEAIPPVGTGGASPDGAGASAFAFFEIINLDARLEILLSSSLF